MPAESSPTIDPAAASVVLDTNVLLDLLLFDDTRARPLGRALHGGSLQALATQPMFDELADVLARPFVADWPVAADAVLAQARRLCRLVEPPAACDGPAPRCADPDDQKFVDLAWHRRTGWLISRDRAVLALARPARACGLRIATPAAWAELTGNA
jgi:predicted nucleic acid-binding protein